MRDTNGPDSTVIVFSPGSTRCHRQPTSPDTRNFHCIGQPFEHLREIHVVIGFWWRDRGNALAQTVNKAPPPTRVFERPTLLALCVNTGSGGIPGYGPRIDPHGFPYHPYAGFPCFCLVLIPQRH